MSYSLLKDFVTFSNDSHFLLIQEEEYDIPEELEDVIGRCMIFIFHALSGIMIFEEL